MSSQQFGDRSSRRGRWRVRTMSLAEAALHVPFRAPVFGDEITTQGTHDRRCAWCGTSFPAASAPTGYMGYCTQVCAEAGGAVRATMAMFASDDEEENGNA